MASLSRSIRDLFSAGGRRGRVAIRRATAPDGGERLESRSLLAASPAPLVALLQDTGSSPTDRITSVGTLAVTAADAATIEYSIDAGKTWSGAFAAKEGVNGVLVRQTVAGSTPSTPTRFGFTLDTTTPAKLVASLANDTGSSKVDRITKDGTLAFVNPVTKKTSVEFGATVQYRTSPSLPWESSFLPVEGANAVSVRQVDKAGNPSEETLVEFTLDKTAPAAPGVSLKNDTNVSDDKITADGTLLTATTGPNAVEVNASVHYSIDNGKTWSNAFTPKNGANGVQVKQVDLAGNGSPATSFAFTYDKTPPAKPLVSLLADTGASKIDRITKDGTLSFLNPSTKKTSLETGAAVEYSTLQIDGTTWSAWSASFTPAEGLNAVKARQIDLAGNPSPESAPLAFTLVQQAPTITAVAGPAANTYKAGESLGFRVTFSRPVVVSPAVGNAFAPTLDITIGGTTRKAIYTGGSGTATLSFFAPVPPGDQGVVAAVGTISLPTNGSQTASLRDLAGNDAPTSFIPSDLGGVVVDARVPVIDGFTFDLPTKTATIIFSRPVTGVSEGDFRIQGVASGVAFNLPLTDSRVKAQIGGATVTGSGTTWKLVVDRLPSGSGSFTLILAAAGSGIVDTDVGNPLLTNAATSLTV